MNCLAAALEYIEYGLSIIPLQPNDKKPLIDWKEYQERIASPEEVESWFESHPDANIGLVTGSVSGVIVIDSDSPEATKWMRESIPKAVLYQKTGNGWHALYKSNGQPVPNSASLIYDKADIRGDGGYIVIAPSVHPNGKKYELTSPFGLGWEDLTPFPYELLKGKEKKIKEKVSLEPVDQGARDDTLARIAGRYCAKGMDEQEVLTMLIGANSKYNPPLPQSDLERIVTSIFKADERTFADISGDLSTFDDACRQESTVGDSFRHGVDVVVTPSRPSTPETGSLSGNIREYIEQESGMFHNNDIDREFDLRSRREKQARWIALSRLEKDGKIKKINGKAGFWRVIKGDKPKMAFDNVSPESFSIPMPLQIGEMVEVYNGSMILVSGTSNAGKTAFLMSTLALSLYTHTKKEKERTKEKERKLLQILDNGIRYLNSEMSPSEIMDWQESLGVNITNGDVEFFECYSDYQDMVLPDGLTFIDFLEINDNFYEVGERLREIHETLRNGVVVIALQKKMGAELGIGGQFTMHKPRLVINLERTNSAAKIAKLAKVKKAVRREDNPEGKQIDYVLTTEGAFKPLTDWRYLTERDRAKQNNIYIETGVKVPRTVGKGYAFAFHLTTGGVGRLTVEQVEKWADSFPGVDVEAELRKIEADSKRKPFLDKGWFHAVPQMLKKKALF
ncbi:MAG: bifunctional DNA primase/polymerase [Deltaproteobacteria bacterium]|nr:bifunctional DNA primase/polymerase [Deltaproteobacteria bacterium]